MRSRSGRPSRFPVRSAGPKHSRPEGPSGGPIGRPAAAFLYHRPRCSNGPRCPRGRASSVPGSPARVRSPSRPTSSPARASRRPRRPASRTSWSTSRSRAPPASRRRRAISEAIEGVGGSFNAATDRESTVYWVRVPRREATPGDGRPRRADRPADARRRRDRGRAGGHRRGDPLVPRRPVGIRPDPLPAGDVRRRPARTRDLRRRGRHPGAPRRRRSATSGGATYRPANTVVALAGDLAHDGGHVARRRGVRDRQRRDPGVRARRPTLPAGERFLFGARRDASQAQLVARRARAPPRPSGCVGAGGAQRRSRRRHVEPALPRRSARRRASPTTCRPGSSTTPMPARSRSRPASTRPDCRRRSRRSSRSSSGCATSRSAATSWTRRRRTCPAAWSSGWTRRATSRRGSAARRRSTTASSRSRRRSRRSQAVDAADDPAAGRRAVPRRRPAAWRSSPRPATLRGLERRLRLPA